MSPPAADAPERIDGGAVLTAAIFKASTKSPLDCAVAALEELVVQTLRSGEHTRFAKAKRICEIGQSLIRAVSESVAELGGCAEPGVNFDYFVGGGRPMPDQRQIAQEAVVGTQGMLELLQKCVGPMEQKTLAETAKNRAEELLALRRVIVEGTAGTPCSSSEEKFLVQRRIAALAQGLVSTADGVGKKEA